MKAICLQSHCPNHPVHSECRDVRAFVDCFALVPYDKHYPLIVVEKEWDVRVQCGNGSICEGCEKCQPLPDWAEDKVLIAMADDAEAENAPDGCRFGPMGCPDNAYRPSNSERRGCAKGPEVCDKYEPGCE